MKKGLVLGTTTVLAPQTPDHSGIIQAGILQIRDSSLNQLHELQ